MLRVYIDGSWDSEDFIDFFSAVESLYCKAAGRRDRYFWRELYISREVPRYMSFDEELELINRRTVDQFRAICSGPERLRISRVEYASPGGADFVGLGKALEAVERIIGRLITFFEERNLRRERDKQSRIKTEKEFESLRTLKIENARRLLEIRRDYPEDFENYLVPLIGNDQDKLIRLIGEGKIVDVRKRKGD